MRSVTLCAMVGSLFLLATASCASALIDPEAQALIDLTRSTKATYSVYTWNEISLPDGQDIEEWAAEFHDGDLHRVETPRDRVIADCRGMTGSHFTVASGEIVRGRHIAKIACGINANKDIVSAEISDQLKLGSVSATRVEILNDDNVLTYDIAPNGAIIGATISDFDGTMRLVSSLNAMEKSVPANIFSEESLNVSAVPVRYREQVGISPETGKQTSALTD